MHSMVARILISSALLLGSTASATNVVMDGYDVVAYHFFTSDSEKGVKGQSYINSTHNSNYGNYTFYFSSGDNKDLFDADPWSYVPKYGGF